MAWTYEAPISGDTAYVTTLTNCVNEIQNAVDGKAALAGSSSQDFATATLTVDVTTASTSTTTGALTVAGGVGIAGALNVGGNAKWNTATSPALTADYDMRYDVLSESQVRLYIRMGGNVIKHIDFTVTT